MKKLLLILCALPLLLESNSATLGNAAENLTPELSATSTSAETASSRRRSKDGQRLRGSDVMLTKDWGAAGDYISLTAGSYLQVTIDPSATTISVTANDNVFEYLVCDRNGKDLKFHITAKSMENVRVSIVVPASPDLSQLTAESYSSIIVKEPIQGKDINVSINSYSSVKADIIAKGLADVRVSRYAEFKGSIESANCDLNISSYANVSAPIQAQSDCKLTMSSYAEYRGSVTSGTSSISIANYGFAKMPVKSEESCTLLLGNYANLSDSIEAKELSLSIGSYADVKSALTSQNLKLSVGNYARVSGSITTETAYLEIGRYSSFDVPFSATTVEALVGSYSHAQLNGSSAVSKARVSVAPNGQFSAPKLSVADYDLTVSSYGRAEVWCSGYLKINAAKTAQVTYDGPCKVEAITDNIHRK